MGVVAFKMKLKENVSEEYIKRHNQIWPELISHLRDMGLSDYRIFLDEEDKRTLFAIQTQSDSFNEDQLRSHPIMKKWWDYMAELMDVEEDNSPVSGKLSELFYMS